MIRRTTDSLLGTYACNLTVTGSDSAGIYRNTYIPMHPSDLTNFSWRLIDMGVSISHVDIEFQFGATHSLNYILGSGTVYSPLNSTNFKYILVDSFNTTGSWNQLVVNITADVENAFGPSVEPIVTRVILDTLSGVGERLLRTTGVPTG